MLSPLYSAAFESEPDRVVYCEHGNEVDPANVIRDYDDPLDTPLGQHIVTDIVPQLPSGWTTEGGNLSDVHRVFPLTAIPAWLAGRTFYELSRRTVRWLLLPLLIVFVVHDLVQGGSAVDVLVNVGFDVAILLLLFGLFLFLAGRTTGRAVRASAAHHRQDDEPRMIRGRLETGEPPPLGDVFTGEVAVFVSGHTHAPALGEFEGPDARKGVIVNSGCWLRQLQPVPARLGAPPVFVSRFVQTHVRVYRTTGGLELELWEHPRPASQRLLLVERLAVIGRLRPEPADTEGPRVRARGTRVTGHAPRRPS
jgi:hypothetical protein